MGKIVYSGTYEPKHRHTPPNIYSFKTTRLKPGALYVCDCGATFVLKDENWLHIFPWWKKLSKRQANRALHVAKSLNKIWEEE